MANKAALEHQFMFENDADPEMPDEPSDPIGEFIKTQELRTLGIDPDRLARETAVIDKRADDIYRKIAAAAAPKTSSQTLAKRASSATRQKVVRTEETHYPLTRVTLVAEIGERGEVLNVYEKAMA